ncbi:MAG: hypothetical protein XD69_0299 [Clostridia bacterium 62_21]|nr:MAG: hypothetical protein XD69_0299 [Clostridia bacterium 62_21]
MLDVFNEFVVQVYHASKVSYGLFTLGVILAAGSVVAVVTGLILRALGMRL